jgi:hypothetical protein
MIIPGCTLRDYITGIVIMLTYMWGLSADKVVYNTGIEIKDILYKNYIVEIENKLN